MKNWVAYIKENVYITQILFNSVVELAKIRHYGFKSIKKFLPNLPLISYILRKYPALSRCGEYLLNILEFLSSSQKMPVQVTFRMLFVQVINPVLHAFFYKKPFYKKLVLKMPKS